MPLGTLMLEEDEGAFGTTVQRLESINAGGFLGGEVGEPLGELSLLAVSSRVFVRLRRSRGDLLRSILLVTV